MKKTTITFLLGIFGFNALPAQAQITQISRWTDTSTGKTYVYFPMQQPEILISHSTNPTAKSYTANACGWVAIKSTSSSAINTFSGNGVTNQSPITDAQQAPTCSDGISNPDLPVGSIVRVGKIVVNSTLGSEVGVSDYYIKTGLGSFSFDISYNKITKVKNNDCGFGRLTVSQSRPLEQFGIIGQGEVFNLSSLPTLNAPDLCRSAFTGGPKIRYAPVP